MRLLDLFLKAFTVPEALSAAATPAAANTPAIKPDATDKNLAYLITRGSEPLAVVSTPAEARDLILVAHDGLDWQHFGSHVFTLASGRCKCGLTEPQLTQLTGHERWVGGTPGSAYWAVEPVPSSGAGDPAGLPIA